MRARKRWSAYFGLALAPDTNVGAASGADTIWLPAFGTLLPFRVNDDARPSSGVGLLVWGGGEYQQPLPDLWGRPLRLRVGGDALAPGIRPCALRPHADRRPCRAALARRPDLGVQPARQRPPGPERGRLRNTAKPACAWRRRSASVRACSRAEAASWHQRIYQERGGLNGPRWQASLDLRWQATPTLSAGLGFGYSAEAPRVQHQRNARPWVQVSANYALPWGFTVGASANFYRTTYEPGPYWRVLTQGDAQRVDRGRSFRLTLLNRAVTLGGFSPQLVGIYEARDSTRNSPATGGPAANCGPCGSSEP